MNKAKMGLTLAGAGLGLMLVDKFTTPAGGTGGVLYGANGVLVPVKNVLPIDPTILLVGAGLALWVWAKFL